MSKTTTKQEWRKDVQGVLETCVHSVISYVDTTQLQVKIVNSLEACGKYFSACEVDCYKRKQQYQFFLETVKEETVISVFQKEMGRENAGKFMVISEANSFNQLAYNIQCSYENIIVNFLLANIVWK